MKKNLCLVLFAMPFFLLHAQVRKVRTEVLVVGGSTGGIAASIQSARSGAKTLIVEQTTWLGGMLTAAGVSCTDGNHDLRSGIWEEFRQALYKHYNTKNLFAGWVSETCFEPHVGDSIFKSWAANENNLQVKYGWYFDKALKQGNKVIGAEFINKKGERLEVTARVTVDATDLGDVFAGAGALYDLGTEDSTQSGEKIAPGKTNVIQDLTWAATLLDYGSGADRTIQSPPGYDAALYYCSTSEAPCKGKPYAANTQKVLDYGKLSVQKGSPNKYMLNWPAHGNDYYLNIVEMKPIDREKEYAKAKNQTLGFIYFLQTELKQKHIGLAGDEMDHGMAFIPYHREGRRVRGAVRLNIDHISSPYNYNLYRTGIAVGDYPVDHHHAQYPGKVPPIPFPEVPSFNVPLGALIPKGIDGLIVCDKGISVSNIANGTTRLQPIVLLTGQAAGILAAHVNETTPVRYVRIRKVQDELLKNKCYLMPFMDIKVDDAAWELVQKMGIMGIMKGVGKSKGWANKTYFYPDSLMEFEKLLAGIGEIDKGFKYKNNAATKYLTLENIMDLYKYCDTRTKNMEFSKRMTRELNNIQAAYHLPKKDKTAFLTRKETAVYMKYLLDFMYVMPLTLDGDFYFEE